MIRCPRCKNIIGLKVGDLLAVRAARGDDIAIRLGDGGEITALHCGQCDLDFKYDADEKTSGLPETKEARVRKC